MFVRDTPNLRQKQELCYKINFLYDVNLAHIARPPAYDEVQLETTQDKQGQNFISDKLSNRKWKKVR